MDEETVQRAIRALYREPYMEEGATAYGGDVSERRTSDGVMPCESPDSGRHPKTSSKDSSPHLNKPVTTRHGPRTSAAGYDRQRHGWGRSHRRWRSARSVARAATSSADRNR